ncbi:hypothetical protein DUNSADRAFT_16515, partial [Dunaliella salina]
MLDAHAFVLQLPNLTPHNQQSWMCRQSCFCFPTSHYTNTNLGCAGSRATAGVWPARRGRWPKAVVLRLESEASEAREVARSEAARREASAAAQSAVALKDAKKTEAKLLQQVKAADTRAAEAEEAMESLRRDADARASTIRWLESQLTSAQDAAVAATEAARNAESRCGASTAQATQAAVQEKNVLQQQILNLQRDMRDLQSQHAAEMSHVE